MYIFLIQLIILLCIFACSNSDSLSNGEDDVFAVNCRMTECDATTAQSEDSSKLRRDTIIDYIPLNDSEYPYAGIPRIVIETEGSQKIKDKETDVSARLQIWGKDTPETNVMYLTIKGRGNTTWGYPKKPYTIKFENKESPLGMAKAKKWILLANYRDRSLLRNAIAFELSRRTALAWTPEGKFVELFLNGQYLGCYYMCEKIEVKKNRLSLDDDAFLLEFDVHYDADFKFKSTFKNMPINVKHPKDIDSSSFRYIQEYVDSVESALLQDAIGTKYLDYINQASFADYIIVYAMANNGEPNHPKSVFMHKNGKDKLTAGPVWDFDYATFNINRNGISNWNSTIFKDLTHKKAFKEALVNRWRINKPKFESIGDYVDSLAAYIALVGRRNADLWPVNVNTHTVGDEKKSFDEAVDMLKKDLQKRVNELDSLILSTIK